jgi:hypothetical protein
LPRKTFGFQRAECDLAVELRRADPQTLAVPSSHLRYNYAGELVRNLEFFERFVHSLEEDREVLCVKHGVIERYEAVHEFEMIADVAQKVESRSADDAWGELIAAAAVEKEV